MNNEQAASQARLEQFVVFVLDNEEYAVPILSVTEVVPTLEITAVPNAPDYILGLTNLRGKIVPVLDLEKKFALHRDTQTIHQHIMIAESGQKVLFGILVDQVKEVLKIPADAIKPPPEILQARISSEYLPGVIVLEGDPQQGVQERILLILDLQKILSEKNVEELQAVQGGSVTPPAPINEKGEEV